MTAAVTPLEARCEACNDTGSRYNSNFLDCTRCTAAIERSTFQSQIYSGEKISLDDKLWRAYQLGKAAVAPVVPVAAQPVVPEGWKLVPVKPTPKMVDSTWGDNVAGMSHNAMNKHIYAAMLAAAPSLEAQPAGEVVKDKERLDWLSENYFSDQKDEWDERQSPNSIKWKFFGPKGIQGRVRDVIDAAMAQGDKA